ncbi:L-asparaginase [Paenibacillus sp. FSL R5-0490]|uniref:asparaginase n=1 Tax=Paenibacillus sp. FSL R5-0490 TaxID=1920424 RepID=UPI00096E33A7|nr:asparaginase [Paenibacillus sp. FSL R5-0490]OMF62162.1 L-asparaginase [Paenibacillus sp. FSL R5-0490]
MENPIVVYRGTFMESTHNIHVAVVNGKGEVLYSYGDPGRLTFPRSSMKPFQAVAVVETGAADQYQYEEADLSLICASHSGEHFHRRRVMSILGRTHLEEEALQCGTHIPRDMESYNELIRSGGELTPVFSNCSGKHSGMLTAVVHMGEDVDSYREVTHPHQQRILDVIEEVCGYPKDQIEISVDGCGVPVHRLPLKHAAMGFARLAQPFAWSEGERPRALERIRKAMTKHPEMVGGTDRFDTDLMKAFNGRIAAKAGAEGVQCLGDVETGLGIAIKVEDGSARAVSVATMEVLKQLGIGDEHIYQQLSEYVNAPVLNARKDRIGHIEANFQLAAGERILTGS